MNAKAATPGANASASDPRRAPRDGAGRTHPRRTTFACCVLAALLLGGGFALHARAGRRAEARDRELSERLAGPLLPGVPDTGESLWTVTLWGRDLEELEVRGLAQEALGADLVRETTPPPPDSFRDTSTWRIGVGTPTESRFFETIRTDPEVREAWDAPEGRSSRGAILVVDGTATNLLPNADRKQRIALLDSNGADLRSRLVSALEEESAREDVSFAEERMTSGLGISLNNGPGAERPGRFRRAVGWCCDQLDFLPLDSLAEWAAEERTLPSDPTFPRNNQILALFIQEGQAVPRRMHQSGSKTLGQLVLRVDPAEPLAAPFRALLAKYRPETLGRRNDSQESTAQRAVVMVVFPDRIEARIVPLSDARLRSLLLDLLRLLADPPPATTSAETSPQPLS
jgi:hypothetical protein